MPDLDVSFMTADPMLSDTITVTRRQDLIDSKGRTQKTVESVTPNIAAVVTQSNPEDLLRDEDGQLMPRVITVCTSFPLRAESRSVPTSDGGYGVLGGAVLSTTDGGSLLSIPGVVYQPDIITWNGNDYVIIGYAPYPTFGQGVYEVLAQSLSSVPIAQ